MGCVYVLKHSFMSTNTKFTGDSSFEDACAFKDKNKTSHSEGYERAKISWAQIYQKNLTSLNQLHLFDEKNK